MWITLWKTFFVENAQKRKKSRFLKTSKKVDKNGILLFFKITFFCAIPPEILTLYSVEVSPFFVLFQTCQKRQGGQNKPTISVCFLLSDNSIILYRIGGTI